MSTTPAPTLDSVLNEIFKQLQKDSFLPTNADKDGLIKEVKTTLHQVTPVSQLKLRDPSVQKALGLSLLACHLKQQDPKFQFDFSLLFKPLADNKAALKEQLKKQIEQCLLKLSPPRPAPAIKKAAKILADELVDHCKGDLLCEDEKKTNLLMATFALAIDPKEEALRSLFGGEKPGEAGGFVATVVHTEGNPEKFETGLVDPDSNALIDKLNTAAEAMEDKMSFPNLFSPKLTMGG